MISFSGKTHIGSSLSGNTNRIGRFVRAFSSLLTSTLMKRNYNLGLKVGLSFAHYKRNFVFSFIVLTKFDFCKILLNPIFVGKSIIFKCFYTCFCFGNILLFCLHPLLVLQTNLVSLPIKKKQQKRKSVCCSIFLLFCGVLVVQVDVVVSTKAFFAS